MKKSVVFVILLILIMPISSAKQVEIPETFKVEEESEQKIDYVGGVTSYFYAGDRLLAVKNSEGISYKYQDRLGSDTNSKQLPFGQVIKESDNKFVFTGKELDGELYYFGARYYDPDLGKFTSVDPIEDEPPYQYVGNNPMNLIDPTGEGSVESGWRLFDVGMGAGHALVAGIWRGDSFGDIIKNTAIATVSSAASFEAKRLIGGGDYNSDYNSLNINPLRTFGGRLLGDVSSSVTGNAIGNRDPFSFIQLGIGPALINYDEGNLNVDMGLAETVMFGSFLGKSISSGGSLDIRASLATLSPVFVLERDYGGGMNLAGTISINRGARQGTLNHELIHSVQFSQNRNYARGAYFGGRSSTKDPTNLLGLGLNVPGDISSTFGTAQIFRGSLAGYFSENSGNTLMNDPWDFYYNDHSWWERQAYEMTGQEGRRDSY